jgi:hypothetical protein
MKNGIGPQSLGAAGMSPNSKPCGTPLDFNAGLRAAEKAGKLPESFAEEVRADSPGNSGTPLPFQDDISKIQEAASTLEAHNIGGGGAGGGAVQGAAAAAQETAASQMGQSRMSAGGGGTPGRRSLLGGLSSFIKRTRIVG